MATNPATRPLQWATCLVLCVAGSMILMQHCQHNTSKSLLAPTDVSILVYETESSDEGSPALQLVSQANRLGGVKASVFGVGKEFEGFGSKYAAVYPLLQAMSPNELVILSDSRDVLMNVPSSAVDSTSAMTSFIAAYTELTQNHPLAIVVSAEAQCCVSALTHVPLGGYFNADGSRNARACMSLEADCGWVSDEKAQPWATFMTEHAHQEMGSGKDYQDLFLNAGLMVGSAQNLMRVIESSAIGKDEDDQAVLTDYMYHNPDEIVLDYGQKLFGNNRGGMKTHQEKEGCIFEADAETNVLVHDKTGTSPLFVHSPGGFLQCHDDLKVKLGLATMAMSSNASVKRRLKEIEKRGLQLASAANDMYESYTSGYGRYI